MVGHVTFDIACQRLDFAGTNIYFGTGKHLKTCSERNKHPFYLEEELQGTLQSTCYLFMLLFRQELWQDKINCRVEKHSLQSEDR